MARILNKSLFLLPLTWSGSLLLSIIGNPNKSRVYQQIHGCVQGAKIKQALGSWENVQVVLEKEVISHLEFSPDLFLHYSKRTELRAKTTSFHKRLQSRKLLDQINNYFSLSNQSRKLCICLNASFTQIYLKYPKQVPDFFLNLILKSYEQSLI